jgi:glutamine amidotransferase
LAAENALGVQSTDHPDGWGVAFFIDGSPHVTRSPLTAVGDALFHRLSGVVSSQTVLAHVRKATRGPKTVFNCHPFQHGRWVFAHNGDIGNFDVCREQLMGEVAPRLRRFVLGETDSEVVFFIFLTQLSLIRPLAEGHEIEEALAALRATVRSVRAISDTGEKPATLTLMATDGELLLATQGGRELNLSTHKTRCSDRDTCPSLSATCEAPAEEGRPVNHFVLSSEPLHGESVWNPLAPGEMVGIDATMRIFKSHVDRRMLPLAG